MVMGCKLPEEMTPEDFEQSPVWEFALDLEEIDDRLLRPVTELPVDDLGNRVVGTQVRLANGARMWAAIQCLHLDDPYKTRHLMWLSFFVGGRWIGLVRYHDPGQNMCGPIPVARALGLDVNDVFPVTYDVRHCCTGDPLAVTGVVEADPKDKLTRAQIMDLISGKLRRG